MPNSAVADNPPSYAIDITTHGSDFLWAVFAVMLLSALTTTVLAFTSPIGKRLFHWVSAALLFTASIAYFSMASNLGKAPVLVEFNRQKGDLYNGPAGSAYRAIWYARYIDWTITTPLLLLDLLLATGLPSSEIFFTIFMDVVMIEAGLIGALVSSQYKWGYFVGGCIAMFYIFYMLLFPARKSAYALSSEAGSVYVKSACVLLFLWVLYPIAWGLADGGNVIAPDSEMVFYGVLDMLAKPGFTFFHLFSLRKVTYETFELQSGHYSIGAHELRSSKNDIPFSKLGNGAGAVNGGDRMDMDGHVPTTNGTPGAAALTARR